VSVDFLHRFQRDIALRSAARRPGVGRTNFRASSPEALQRRVAAIEATGLGGGWQDGDPGYGPVYVFTDPDGHELSFARPLPAAQ